MRICKKHSLETWLKYLISALRRYCLSITQIISNFLVFLRQKTSWPINSKQCNRRIFALSYNLIGKQDVEIYLEIL